MPAYFTKQQKQQLINQVRNYTIENELLYKKDRKDATKLYRIIRKKELPAVLYMMHNDPTSGHFATDAMFHKIKTRYYWPQYCEDIKNMWKHVTLANEENDQRKIIFYTRFLSIVHFIKLESILLDHYLVQKEERSILLSQWITLLNGQKQEPYQKLPLMQLHNSYMNRSFVNMVALKLFLVTEELISIIIR